LAHLIDRGQSSFIERPAKNGLKMAESPDIAKEQRWYQVEIGRSGRQIWLAIDGLPLLWAYDPEGGLPGGYLGFRLRGPGDGSSAALYRNITIEPMS
jgi:hypothetical protein